MLMVIIVNIAQISSILLLYSFLKELSIQPKYKTYFIFIVRLLTYLKHKIIPTVATTAEIAIHRESSLLWQSASLSTYQLYIQRLIPNRKQTKKESLFLFITMSIVIATGPLITYLTRAKR